MWRASHVGPPVSPPPRLVYSDGVYLCQAVSNTLHWNDQLVFCMRIFKGPHLSRLMDAATALKPVFFMSPDLSPHHAYARPILSGPATVGTQPIFSLYPASCHVLRMCHTSAVSQQATCRTPLIPTLPPRTLCPASLHASHATPTQHVARARHKSAHSGRPPFALFSIVARLGWPRPTRAESDMRVGLDFD